MVGYKARAQSLALAIADSLYSTGNYSKAINFYAKVGSEKSSLQVARAYDAMGNYDKAKLQYENVINKNSSLQIGWLELGKIYLKTHDLEKAVLLFNQLIDDDDRNPEFYYYLGRAYQDMEKMDESLNAYRNSVKIDSTHLRSIFRLGKYYVGQIQRDSVLKYVDKGLRFYKDDVALINLKALAYYNEDGFREAAPLFERVLDLGEDKTYIYEKLGYCYFNLEDFEKARSNYKIVLDRDIENAIALNGLGHVFWKQKQLDSASVYFKKAIRAQKIQLDAEYKALSGIAMENHDLKKSLDYSRLAYQENTSSYMNYYQICILADQYYKDPKKKLGYYENFIKKFGTDKGYFSAMAKRRVSELKEEIHFAKD